MTGTAVTALCGWLWWQGGGLFPLVGLAAGVVTVALAVARPWVLGQDRKERQ